MKKPGLYLTMVVVLLFSFNGNTQNYVLNENFSNNNNKWDISNTEEVVSSIKKGRYHAGIKSGIYWLDRLIEVNIDESLDWVFESEMVKKSGDAGFGLTWGGDNGGSRYNFYISSDLAYTINKWDDYDVSSFASGEQSSAIKQDGKTNKLTIKKEGDKLKFYVNDQFLKQIDYEPLFGKYFGFYGNSGSLVISVDFIRVYYTQSDKPVVAGNDVKISGNFVFKEDFDNNKNNWPVTGGYGIERSVRKGKYTWEGTGSDFNSNWDFVPIVLDQEKDFVIESSIKKVSGPESGWGFGLLWGNDTNRFTVFGSSGSYSIVGDIYARLSSTAVNTGNSVNKLTIKKTEGKLKFFINDEFLSEAVFEPFDQNQIGFYSYQNGVKIEIEYLYIYYPGETVVTPAADIHLSAQEKLVSDFIQLWINDYGNNEKMMEFISPKYLKSNKLDKSKYSVNLYYPNGFDLKSFDKKNGLVVVNVWGENKKWVHKLTFKVVTEKYKRKKALFLYPSKFSESMYIYPWKEVETNVSE